MFCNYILNAIDLNILKIMFDVGWWFLKFLFIYFFETMLDGGFIIIRLLSLFFFFLRLVVVLFLIYDNCGYWPTYLNKKENKHI